MGKFRSKLKRHTKGKAWGHGQSATSNPENKKHRNKARSRFFQPNLSLAPQDGSKPSALTAEAVYNHDVRQSYANGGKTDGSVNDIATSLKSFAFDGDDDMAQSEQGTFKTYKTFASSYSSCTNMSFNKLLNGFRSDSETHKEMLAILAALTAVINERGGSGTSTEYFLALMETIDAASEDKGTVAAVNLLSMGIKSVPEAILRKKFSETAVILLDIMKRYVDDSDNQNVLRAVLSCMSTLLRAQEYAIWQMTSTQEYFDAMLAFVTHTKPKIRKSAQQSITSVIHGSCFMVPPPPAEDAIEGAPPPLAKVAFHPAGHRVAKFCIHQFKPDNIANSHTVVLHTLGLLRDTMHGFKSDDIKTICEHLLSIMTAANVLIRTNCFHVMHSLFSSKSRNLSANLTGKLITALYEYRPEKSDVRQTLAWLTVLKEAHVCLSSYDLGMTVAAVPNLIEICASELWMSERNEVVNGASNTIKELFVECIKPACETKAMAGNHREPIVRAIQAVNRGLSAPFGQVASQVVLTFATVFEVTGKWFGKTLSEPLRTIGGRYDAESSFRLQIEHTILAAIPAMGPEFVLHAIPLTKAEGSNEMDLTRTWILPLLREAVSESTLDYFINYILNLAVNCNKLWKHFMAAKDAPMAHTYELLCSQLWGLFPGFCRRPRDIENFRYVAKTLGTVLKDNAELRAPVLDGLKALMVDLDEDGKKVLGVFAKNFLPLLFNIYITKPSGSYEGEIRASTMEVIKEYLKITPRETLDQLYGIVEQQQAQADAGSFTSDSLYDIVQNLALYQSCDKLKSLFDDFVTPVLTKSKKPNVAKGVEKIKKQQRKAYQLLENILASDLPDCLSFVESNIKAVQDLVLGALKTTCNTTQASRLNCIKLLMEKQTDVSLDNALIIRTIPEVIVAFNHGANKRDNVAVNLIIKIGEICRADGKLNDFIDTIIPGFGGDSVLIANTILTLKAVVSHFALDLLRLNTRETLTFVLEQVLAFLVGRNRNEAEASIAFLITFIKVLPTQFVALHLETISRALSSMVPDTKRYCRIHIGFILKKLCKRFTAEEIIKHVPGNDEVMHKKLKNIRKEQNRAKRLKTAKQNADDDSDEEDLDAGLEKKSYTIDDILADSDSDFEMDEESKAPAAKKSKKHDSFIQEAPESIVDLADVNAIGRITSSKPQPKTGNTLIDKDKKAKDANRGFKTADDGRLIIAEPKRGEAVSDSDDDFDVDDAGGDAAAKNLTSSNKRTLDDESDSDAEEATAPSRKRKATDSQSMASGRTGASSKYVAGGRGIHRPTSGSASVRSGASRMSAATTKSASTAYGSAFKAKKAKGDMKAKGGKLDPYAYIPLSRNSLNKRKRAKNAGQFNNVVAGARKGAAAGSKNRIQKSKAKK